MADKPKDYTRCAGCRRLTKISEAFTIDGALYGRECARLIRSNYRLMQNREQG